ncbi:GLABROUS1 enhancer-binding protein-like [Durio zibethinus]|uniref:GLABROUS1 enhancer-binding protein-like n=1 Tax=Durio zibethinus TaxID=66656 RepID=A0A6P5WN85_DURZI|nr:GLABROUS1 enhancer-binding protein-like [Durio zibethinus]
MARKRSKIPIEDPPAAASSSSSSSSEEEEETSSEEEETQTPQTIKNPTLNVKPIATKPMEETSKIKKPRSKLSASPVKASSAKRPSESEQEPKEVKRPKKKTSDEEGTGSATAVEEVNKTGEDAKKQLFQRLFSEDDEIAVLKGMLDYLAKKGVDPFANANAFHDFVKKSIHTDVSKAQLMYKVRRLRKKFENNAGKGKNGKDRIFSKPHEQKIFELSKTIWGREGITGNAESSAAKSNGKEKENSKTLVELNAESLFDKKVDDRETMEVDKKQSKSLGNLFDKMIGVGGLEEEVIKHGLDMIGGEKREALEEKWRKLQIAELELFLKRNELLKEQAKLMLDFYKSEDA